MIEEKTASAKPPPPDATMPRDRMDRFLRKPIVAVLSWVTAKGSPVSSPVWFEYRDSKFYLHAMTETSKVRSMLKNPSVALCIQDPTPPYRYVTVRASARVIDDSKAGYELDRRLARKYLGRIGGRYYIERVYPTFPGESRVVELTPTSMPSLDGTTAVPLAAIVGMRVIR